MYHIMNKPNGHFPVVSTNWNWRL